MSRYEFLSLVDGDVVGDDGGADHVKDAAALFVS